MKCVFRISLLGLAVSMGMTAQAADLISLFNEARLQDPTYLAAEKAREAGQEARVQGKALLRPTVGFQGDLTYNWTQFGNNNPARPDQKIDGTSGRLSLQASQPLWNKDKSLAAEQGDLSTQAADAQFQVDTQDLILRTAQVYFDVLDAQDNVELVAAQKAATTQQLAQAKKAFEVGTATITDTHEAQARYDLIVAQEIAAMNDLAVKQNALRELTGKEPQPLAPLRTDSELRSTVPTNLQQWLDQASSANWRLKLQELNEAIAERGLGRADAAHWPTLDAIASAGQLKDPEGLEGYDLTAANLGLQLKIPLYAGGALNSRSREALALRDKARLQTEAARRQVEQSVRQAYLNTTSGLARVTALEQALVSTKSTLDSTTLGRQVGVRTNLDVLNAQQQFYSARRDLALAKYRYLLSRLQLEATAGELTLDDLQTINSLLEH